MQDCRKAIELCTSLHTFRCTESNVFPAFLMALQHKPNLQSIRINGNLTTEQTKLLVNMTALSEVMLEYASWNLVDALPQWTESLRRTLNTLVLYTSHVSDTSLSTHATTCPHPPTPTILVTLLEHLKISAPGISSFTMKLSERKVTIVPSFINRLIEVYGSYLKKVAFLDCSLENESIKKISQKCPQLERLDVSIPIREAYSFGDLLSSAKHLTTLVDVDTHTQHGIRPSLSFDVVQTLMQKVPSLKTLVSDKRVWVAELDEDRISTPKLDRRLPMRSRASWFLPSNISSS
ncbi:hypothetical protein H1R20_g14185, partial [Candolleomyces eurysporus]